MYKCAALLVIGAMQKQADVPVPNDTRMGKLRAFGADAVNAGKRMLGMQQPAEPVAEDGSEEMVGTEPAVQPKQPINWNEFARNAGYNTGVAAGKVVNGVQTVANAGVNAVNTGINAATQLKDNLTDAAQQGVGAVQTAKTQLQDAANKAKTSVKDFGTQAQGAWRTFKQNLPQVQLPLGKQQ